MSALSLAVAPANAFQHPLPGLTAQALSRMLDVVDYAMIVVVEGAVVAFANAVAHAELDDAHPLRLAGGQLHARDGRDAQALGGALHNALRRGMQSMLCLNPQGSLPMPVSVLPLRGVVDAPAALLVVGRRQLCEELSVEAFARAHALTEAETRVLKLLCAGRVPADIAASLGVKLSTVRTQIGAIRLKTGARDIRSIVQTLSRLPPMPCLVRRAA